MGVVEGPPVTVEFNPLWNLFHFLPCLWVFLLAVSALHMGRQRWLVFLPLAVVQCTLVAVEWWIARGAEEWLIYLDAAALLSPALASFWMVSPSGPGLKKEQKGDGVAASVLAIGCFGAFATTRSNTALLFYALWAGAVLLGLRQNDELYKKKPSGPRFAALLLTLVSGYSAVCVVVLNSLGGGMESLLKDAACHFVAVFLPGALLLAYGSLILVSSRYRDVLCQRYGLEPLAANTAVGYGVTHRERED